MSLTATATKTTRNCIVKSLDMQLPETVSNIVYCVFENFTIRTSLGAVADRRSCQRTTMDRIIIIKNKLRTQFTEPPVAPDLALVNMFAHCIRQSKKVKDLPLKFCCRSLL